MTYRRNILGNKTGSLTIDPGVAGDSYIQYTLPGVPTNTYRVGVDDSDNDAFKISKGGALGTNDYFTLTSAGQIRKPLQPAFYAYLPSDDLNVTGDGTNYVIGTNTALTEVYDQTGDFNTNGTFTAPITGTYEFSLCVYFGPLTTDHTGAYATFDASNHDVEFGYVNPDNLKYNPGTDDSYSLITSCYVQMDAADTMNFRINVTTTGKTVDLFSGSGFTTVVSGYLVL